MLKLFGGLRIYIVSNFVSAGSRMVSPKFKKMRFVVDSGSFQSDDKFRVIAESNALLAVHLGI
jgi:hypothetical protein